MHNQILHKLDFNSEKKEIKLSKSKAVREEEEPKVSRAQEIGDSYINGNISWARDEIGGDMKLFKQVSDYIREFEPDKVARFQELMVGESKQVKEERGKGLGVGGERQVDGGSDICICPNACGYEIEHVKGTPCNEMKCPTCDIPLIGKNIEQKEESGDLSCLK